MARREFSRKTKALAHARAGGKCEGCGAKLKAGEGEVDHKVEAHDGGAATLDNAQVLCRVCHAAKTAGFVKRLRKAERVRDKQTGALASKSPPIRSAGFKPAPPQRRSATPSKLASLPKPSLYGPAR
jgi:5-methylcytosine-specific restriction enzyme A